MILAQQYRELKVNEKAVKAFVVFRSMEGAKKFLKKYEPEWPLSCSRGCPLWIVKCCDKRYKEKLFLGKLPNV